MRQRLDELDALIEREEAESKKIDVQRADLQAKLQTVIAPREAEALQNEIRTLEQRRSELDDAELAALEEQSRIDDELSAHLEQEQPLREALMASDTALVAAEADIDGELTRISERLEGLRSAVEPGVLKRYDRIRAHHVVAAAPLAGSRCEGCHLDLSAAEVDIIRDDAGSGGLAECPQCGRLLVV
jgi:predicted  nucleic acid-binding Zn-ribbon protein